MSDNLQQIQKEWHGTLQTYLTGFFVSLLLTAASFFLVIAQPLTGQPLIYILVGLALVQAIFQLRFFLHLGEEEKPRWESLLFYFMVMILLIIAVGSIWIMNDLNARMMMPGMKHD